MDVLVYPSRLCGTLIAPPAKSTLHRALIAAAFADRPTRLCLQRQDGISDDIAATIRCLQALGAKIVVQRQEIYVQPAKETPRQPVLDCGESGSTLRFLLPVTAARCDAFRIHGRGRLLQRPLADLQAAMSEHGCVFHSDAGSLLVRGQLQGGDFFCFLIVIRSFPAGRSHFAICFRPAPGCAAVCSRLQDPPLFRFGIGGLCSSDLPGDAGFCCGGIFCARQVYCTTRRLSFPVLLYCGRGLVKCRFLACCGAFGPCGGSEGADKCFRATRSGFASLAAVPGKGGGDRCFRLSRFAAGACCAGSLC